MTRAIAALLAASLASCAAPPADEPPPDDGDLVQNRGAGKGNSIVADETPFVISDGDREYTFEGFTVLTPDPLPPEIP